MAKKIRAVRRSKPNIALMKQIIVEFPGISYKEFCAKWLEMGRSKASTPKSKSFHNTRSYMKTHGITETGHGNTSEVRARYVDQAQVEKGFKASRTRTNKVKAKTFMEMEAVLEGLVAKADALKHSGLAEKIREARRIVGSEIIHVL